MIQVGTLFPYTVVSSSRLGVMVSSWRDAPMSRCRVRHPIFIGAPFPPLTAGRKIVPDLDRLSVDRHDAIAGEQSRRMRPAVPLWPGRPPAAASARRIERRSSSKSARRRCSRADRPERSRSASTDVWVGKERFWNDAQQRGVGCSAMASPASERIARVDLIDHVASSGSAHGRAVAAPSNPTSASIAGRCGIRRPRPRARARIRGAEPFGECEDLLIRDPSRADSIRTSRAASRTSSASSWT